MGGTTVASSGGGGGVGMMPWCVLVCSWRRQLADRHFPGTLSLRRRWWPSAYHHLVSFLSRLTCWSTLPPEPGPGMGAGAREEVGKWAWVPPAPPEGPDTAIACPHLSGSGFAQCISEVAGDLPLRNGS